MNLLSMKRLSLSGPVCMLSRARLRAIAWTIARQAPLSMGSSGQECWGGLPFPPAGDLADPGIQPAFLESSCTGRQPFFFSFLTTTPPGKHRLQNASSRFQSGCRRLLPLLFMPLLRCCLSEVKCSHAPRSKGTSRVSAHSGRPSPATAPCPQESHCSCAPGPPQLSANQAPSSAPGEYTGCFSFCEHCLT